MSAKPKVIVLRSAGTNCDRETIFAFEQSGASVDAVHVNQLIRGEKKLNSYHILAIPGGFTYGDDVAAGKILANELRCKLGDDVRRFLSDGKLIIGICNGFQVLVKAGLLPGNAGLKQEATLTLNDSAKFEDRWTYLKSQKPHQCIWAEGLPEIVYFPVAHGEGKFVVEDTGVLARLKKNNQIIFRYCKEKGALGGYPDNPNGSLENIAGICDETGRILGLMPHPERHFLFTQHPRWTRLNKKGGQGDGVQIFRNGVEYAQRNL